MSNLFYCLGPPGTGKTTWMARQVERAVEAQSPYHVLVCSFTRAAVAELNRRDLPIPEENLGTLHALAYRQLQHPEICETGKHLKAFSEDFPRYAMSHATRTDVDDGYANGGAEEGDNFLLEYSRLRALMTPREQWPLSLLHFAQCWEQYKHDTGTLDFTDLIERALLDVEGTPGGTSIGFLDEAQDFTRLEFALVNKWASQMEKAVLVFDPDQSIYAFKGADPQALIDNAPPNENIKTLKQSYRVSQAVHAFSEEFVNQIGSAYRLPREYLPTEEPGAVYEADSGFNEPERIIEAAWKFVEQGKSVLVLAACSYMLAPIIRVLRDEGLPFANPYRRRRRDWNPLLRAKKQVGAADRVGAFLRAFERETVLWTLPEVEAWLPLTKGVAKRGWQEYAATLPRDKPLGLYDLDGVVPIDTLEAARKEGLSWLHGKLNATWALSGDYAIRVGMRGPSYLEEEPRLMLGTIHSVKGGEADVVILSPDLSPQGFQEWLGEERQKNNVVRQFFVGATRARDTLILARPTGRMSVEWR